MRTRFAGMLLAAFASLCALAVSACQAVSHMNLNQATPQATVSAGQTTSLYVSTTGSDSTGDGTIRHPWATIAHAAANATPGTTINIAAGTYTGSFTTRTSGTSSAYIVYQATTADFSSNVNCAQVAANLGDLSTCPHLVGTDATTTWTNMGDYVAIEGFDVTGPGLNGIYTQGKSTLISNNHVHNVLTSTCNDDGGSGINLNGTNAKVIGNYVHNIGPYPTACGFVQGIYFLGSGGYAWNNISFNNSGFGIQLWHYPAHIALVNNTIFKNASGGIVLGTDTAVTVDYIDVINNIVVDNGGYGIQEQGQSSSSTGVHNVYSNNLVEGNPGGAIGLQNGLKATATVAAQPQFINYTGTSAGNYHLLPGSPAVAGGTTKLAPPVDFDGNARPSTGPISIGAYQGAGGSN